MSSDDSLKLKALTAFFSAYADLKDQGDITREQFNQVNEVIEDIENIEYDELITRLIEIFPDYQPKEFGLFKLND